MPDLDLIRAKVSLRFRKTYDLVKEDMFRADHIARQGLDDLRSQLRVYGLGPVYYLKDVSIVMDRAQAEPVLIHWPTLYSKLRDMALDAEGNSRGVELAHRAAASQASGFEHKGIPVTSVSLLRRYIRNVYDADFAQRVPFVRGVQAAQIDHGLALIDEPVNKGIEYFARQIAKRGDLEHLRRPRHEKQTINLDLDLLDIKRRGEA